MTSVVDEISVFGLGKLGACLAATFANADTSVTGIDIDKQVVSQLNDRQAPFTEPKLQSYLDEAEDFQATTPSPAAIAQTDVSFIVVNTPSTEDGKYSLKYIKEVCKTIGNDLTQKDDYHLVVVTSTVFPGSTMGEIREWLESSSKKTAGEDFGLCYSPEFIALGDVINGLEDPDFFLIGEQTERGGDALSTLYRKLNESVPILRMPPLEAEIAKMAINSYMTMKISYANTLSQICDSIGADVDTVTEVLTSDSRINGAYLTAGARFGGLCFPRDNIAFEKLAEVAGTDAPLARSTDVVNNQHTEWIADRIRESTPEKGTIAILGLTYKPNTYIVKESQGVDLVQNLASEYKLQCYDPLGMPNAKELTRDEVNFADSVGEALQEADTAVITIPWDTFQNESTYEETNVALIDPWRLFDSGSLPETVTYRPIGTPDPAHVDRGREETPNIAE